MSGFWRTLDGSRMSRIDELRVSIELDMNLFRFVLLLIGSVAAAAAPATAPTSAPATAPEAILSQLADAKVEHERALAAAKESLLGTIDARLNAAADAGDLKMVQVLQAVKRSAENDGTVPDTTPDSAVKAAKTAYAHAVEGANIDLAVAYRDAVRDLTRARRIDDAAATQAEFDASPVAKYAAAASAVQSGSGGPKRRPSLVAQVFNDVDFTALVRTKFDDKIDYNWVKNRPDAQVRGNKFSIRWTGILVVPQSGVSAIGISANDGARVYLDDKQLIHVAKPNKQFVREEIAPGPHKIQVDYWNTARQGHVQLFWVLAGPNGQEQIVPPSALFHMPAGPKP